MEEESGHEGMEQITAGDLDVQEETVRIQNSRQGIAMDRQEKGRHCVLILRIKHNLGKII